MVAGVSFKPTNAKLKSYYHLPIPYTTNSLLTADLIELQYTYRWFKVSHRCEVHEESGKLLQIDDQNF